MMKWKRMLGALMAAGLLVSAMPMEALAATKYVTSISLKVHAELEAGDSLNNNDDIGKQKQDSGTYVYTTSSRYNVVDAQWANDKDISIGDEPKMYVWLEVNNDDDSENEWKFRSSYSSSNVSVSGGSYVSSSKSGGDLKVTIRVNPSRAPMTRRRTPSGEAPGGGPPGMPGTAVPVTMTCICTAAPRP